VAQAVSVRVRPSAPIFLNSFQAAEFFSRVCFGGGKIPYRKSGSTKSERSSAVLENYLPVLIFLAIGTIVGVAMLTVGKVLAPRRPDSEKDSPYECGFEAFEDSRMKFDVRYYLVAILFIIFDLEIAFLFPWAVVLDSVGAAAFVGMAIFIAVLVVGFIYEWKKGALEWE
jgi:NADH-quinone oxidoreductase subunit A